MIRIDEGSIRALLEDENDDVLSLYVPVDPSDPSNQKSRGSEAWRIWLKNELKRLDDESSTDALGAAAASLEGFLVDYTASGRTFIAFVRPDGQMFAEIPVRLEPAAAFGRPAVGPLLQAMDEYRHYLVALIAADGYRLLSGYLGFVGEIARVELDANWGMQGATRSAHQFKFEAHREQHQRGYQRGLAADIDRVLFDNPDIDRVILGGNEKEAHGVRHLMHPKTAESVVAILPVPVNERDGDIIARVEPAAIAYERDRESALVDRIVEMTRSGGRASMGRSDVMGLLERGSVRTLIVASPQDEPVEPLLRLAFQSSASVEIVHGEAAERLRSNGGVACELYYL